jgi:hypothetical protein
LPLACGREEVVVVLGRVVVVLVVAVTAAAAVGDAREFSGAITTSGKTHQHLLASLGALNQIGRGGRGQQEAMQWGEYREPFHARSLH